MLPGPLDDTGLSLPFECAFSECEPLIPFVPFTPFTPFTPFACPLTVAEGSFSGSTSVGKDNGAVCSTGEYIGGGMFVPSVRESRGARTGSSNFRILLLLMVCTCVAEGIFAVPEAVMVWKMDINSWIC